MAAAIHSNDEEASFLNGLFADLDRDFSSSISSPPKPFLNKPSLTRSEDANSISARNLAAQEICDIEALLDGAETWDWGDIEADILTPKKNGRSPEPTKPSSMLQPEPYDPETCTRCTVESVLDVTANGRRQKHLTINTKSERRLVILCDDWTQADIQTGDVLNVIGEFSHVPSPSSSSSPISTITITSKRNLFIHHPDLLVTATALSNVSSCIRRPLLSSLVRSSSDFSPALVWGNMLHEVVQICLMKGRWDDAFLSEQIEEVVQRALSDLVKISATVTEATREVKARAKGLRTFADKYIAPSPKDLAILSDTRSKGDQTSLLAITRLHDVEEDIWSPTYGLKGKLDATVQTIIQSGPSSSRARFDARTTVTTAPLPFEIKTGRANQTLEHRAQTMLYTLLASERYGVKVEEGLLYYTQSEDVIRVPRGWNELRGLLVGRNQLAGWTMKRLRANRDTNKTRVDAGQDDERFLPPTIDDERLCKRCYGLDSCMLYRKAVDNVIDTTSPIADIYALRTGHLTPSQCEFFKKWEDLISMEEGDLYRFRKELWTMGAAERERVGRCFSGMLFDDIFRPPPLQEGGKVDKIHRFTYRFVRANGGLAGGQKSLLDGFMCVGDAITVSVEPNLLALARGFIIKLNPRDIVLGVDHQISMDAIREHLVKCGKGAALDEIVFRIDKDELIGGMGRVRENLARLFYADGDKRLLELVVDLRKPTFVPPDAIRPPPVLPTTLNDRQCMAISKALTAEDYALILGMPGTGKTTVIATLIRILAKMGKTILLTSYTHSAVDTILAKLSHEDFGILRIGNLDKVHPDIRKFTLACKKTPVTLETLEHQLSSPLVVATTCLSIEHPLFSLRTFDYCIIDEASQITLPTCLGPLRFADKFILVGDHFQLPPLVKNKGALKGGLDVSLFRRLSDSHPHAVVDLTDQYRMNEDIMLLSNKLIYGDRLRCGSQAVAQRGLLLPDRKFMDGLHRSQATSCRAGGCWMEKLMAESCKAVFVDTDLVPAPDSRVGELVQNTVEATLIHQVAELLIHSGVRQEQIGIISLYRQQVKLLTQLMQDFRGVEILTADRSQGRDKDCIIISMVRSNASGEIGELVKDWRRVNVSFTRARSKLIIFGSRKTLGTSPLLAEFFELMDDRGWVVSLPPHAHGLHPLRFAGQAGASKRATPDAEALGKENPMGPAQTKDAKRLKTHQGLLRGRPILRDVMNGGK